MTAPRQDAPIAIAGATGHVGSALARRLLADGRRVRALVRDASRLDADLGAVEVVQGDLSESGAMDDVLAEGCVAYFLVHSLGAGGSLAETERALAENFAAAARRAGAARIVYLGGLVDAREEHDFSDHMASRVEVGRILRESGVQTLEFRASIVVGAGSFSFELIRRVVELAPVVVLPGWVDNLAQPIALDDVVAYLASAATADVPGSAVFEIGGADRISYRGLIERFAELTNVTRATVALPVPEAAAAAAGRLARPLVERLPGDAEETLRLLESLRHTTVVRDDSAGVFGISPMGVDAAIEAALAAGS